MREGHFLAGMEAEFEVAKLMGSIEALKEMNTIRSMLRAGVDEKKLQALLEGK